MRVNKEESESDKKSVKWLVETVESEKVSVDTQAESAGTWEQRSEAKNILRNRKC